MKYGCCAFHNDAEHAHMYAFRRSKSPARLFACVCVNITTLEYTTFITVWAPSVIWQHCGQRKYTVFVVRLIQNRLAARCFDDDHLRKPMKSMEMHWILYINEHKPLRLLTFGRHRRTFRGCLKPWSSTCLNLLFHGVYSKSRLHVMLRVQISGDCGVHRKVMAVQICNPLFL